MIRVFGPPIVKTPDIVGDIRRFFCPQITEAQTTELLAGKPKDVKNRLYAVAERFEFVQHLLFLRELLGKAKSVKEMRASGEVGDQYLQLEVVERIKFHGQECTGLDYDLEALCFYLLLTCIELLVSPPYKQMDCWLERNWSRLSQSYDGGVSELEMFLGALDEYRDSHGLRRNFRRAIIEEVPTDLRARFVNRFAVVKTKDGAVNPQSWQSWVGKSDEQKIDRIARFLYDDVRSKFTHSSHRTLFPSVPIEYLPANSSAVLVRLAPSNEDNIFTLLQDVVSYLARSLLLG